MEDIKCDGGPNICLIPFHLVQIVHSGSLYNDLETEIHQKLEEHPGLHFFIILLCIDNHVYTVIIDILQKSLSVFDPKKPKQTVTAISTDLLAAWAVEKTIQSVDETNQQFQDRQTAQDQMTVLQAMEASSMFYTYRT